MSNDFPSRSTTILRRVWQQLPRWRLPGLVVLTLAIIAGLLITFVLPGQVLGVNGPSYVSPGGQVVQNPKAPSSFGDADDLTELGPAPAPLAVGSNIVSGYVTDAATGLPVANADVGISLGTVGSGATYTTTAADGSYSFSLASGTYNLASSRYTLSGLQPLYALSTKMVVAVNSNVVVNFSLNAIPVSSARPNICNRAKNLILIDYDETYYESFFTDPNSVMNNTPAIHSIASGGVNAAENWTTYGWSPIDHYQIAVGNYPAWRSPDAPGPVWGQPDGLDTNIWYNGSEHFLMESIFDVAKSYGMSTAVIGGNDYPTGHITDANVDLIQLGQNPSGVPTIWATEVENFITAHASNPNGFLIYLPATMAEGKTVESTSPDASNSAYQTAASQDDQAIQGLLNWLQTNGYTANTVLIATADEAENDHTAYDNFYGNGSTGLGTTRHVPFAIKGPGIVSGPITYTAVMNMDDEPTNVMQALNLPAPIDSRGRVISNFFSSLSCGGTPTPTPIATPTSTPTSLPRTSTPTNTPLPPTVTSTPSGAQHLVISQVYGGAGCSTANCSTYKNDYIEVFNPGTTAQSLNGWSIQYTSAAGTSWSVTTLPNFALGAGQYFLIQESGNANGTNSLPPPDATGTIAMNATTAKVALVNTATALSGSCPTNNIVDLVGYGSSVNCSETSPAPAPSTTTADLRSGSGCTDTNNNAIDFTATTPNPHNSSSPLNPCGGATPTNTPLPPTATPTPSGVQHLVISQVYGGAGCSTANCSTYKNDYIEVFNPDTTAQSLNGWSIQYASAAGTSWLVTTLPNFALGAGQYFLIQESGNANGTNSLPPPDATGTIAMNATTAKVALVNTATALSGSCPTNNIVDLVGYGSSANCSETSPAPAPSTTTADLRSGNGCTDTNNNAIDFTATTPNPHNSSSPLNPCGSAMSPSSLALTTSLAWNGQSIQ